MKFRGHTCGLFITIVVATFGSVFLTMFIINQVLSPTEVNGLLYFVLLVPVFFGSYFLSARLYRKHFRLSCPDCGREIRMNYQPGVPVTYRCDHCGYSYDTKITIGNGDWGY